MSKYIVIKRKKKKLFIWLLTLVFIEWAIFTLYASIDLPNFLQRNELQISRIYYGRNDTINRNLALMASRDENAPKVVQTTTINYTSFQNCTKKTVKLSGTPLKVTGLVSFPGSGSTWLRHLVQQLTGIGTSSMYCDGLLRNKGFPFECKGLAKQGSILVKTHEEKHFKGFQKIVLIVRNPYEALLAYFSWAKGGHTANPSKKSLIEASNKMFNQSLWWYVDLTNGSLTRFKGPVHIVQYERLKTDLAYELRELASFLQANVTLRDLACTVNLQEGNFHRNNVKSARIELLRTIFDEERLSRLKIAAGTTRKLIKDNLNVTIDVGGSMEKLLFEKSKANLEQKNTEEKIARLKGPKR